MADERDPDVPADEVAALLRLAGPRPSPPRDAEARVRLAVHDEWEQTVRNRARRRTTTWLSIGLAAAASMVILVNVKNRIRGPQPVTPSEAVMVAVVERTTGRVTTGAAGEIAGLVAGAGREIRSGSTIRTGPDSFARLRSISGASVRLDASTEVRLPDRLTLHLERGAIYIDSGPGGHAGIEVRTPFGIARDVGTRFEVRLGERALRVRVREGLVRLEHRGSSYDGTAGFELLASPDGAVERRVVALHGADWDWTVRAGAPFALEGRTLDTFLQWIEREGGWRVKFEDAGLERSASTIVLHGSIDGLTPADALGVVLPTCGLAHRTSGNDLVIARAPSQKERRP
jgi:ferric-dicitrate binding protein FerR (iron transport regulator)